MDNVRRISDHIGSSERTGPAPDARVEVLMNQVACSLAELQSLLAPSADGRTGVASTASLDGHDLALHAVGGIDLKINVRAAKNLRHLRRKMFGEEFFSGPGWSVLLQLFEARILQRTETIGQVSLGAEVPCATALRWLSKLSDEGLVELRDDHLDRRRRFVELSDNGAHLMMEYFSGAAPHLVAA